MKTSLVIPIYNEELNIKILFNEILDTGIYSLVDEIIYVDDYSSDNSFDILKKIEKKYNKVTILRHEVKRGQSMAIWTAANFTNNEVIVTIDGDGQNNPKDIKKLLEMYISDNEIFLVGGIRKKRKDSFIKIISSIIANKFRILILSDDCIDTGCSLKVFNKSVFLSFPFFSGIHRFLPALFKGYGKKTFFINVDHRHRIYGQTKYGTIGRLIAGIKDLIKVVKIIRKFKSDHD